MKISVVIPTFNSGKTIEKCLRSLNGQTYSPHEIIVVDGGSTDSTIEKVKGSQGVRLFLNEQNNTPGSNRNIGAEKANGEILFFFDSDCIADKGVLKYHLMAYKKRDDIVGVMGSILNAGPRNAISDFVQKQVMASGWLGNLKHDGTIKSHFSCANFTITQNDFLEEKFREDLISYEDTELFIRLNQKGLKILYEPRAIVYHCNPTTIKQLFKRYMWYGEGIIQVNKIHGKYFRNKYLFYSPARYITFSEDYLQEAVFFNNRLLCKDCIFDSLQKCKIRDTQQIKNIIDSDIGFHRITCLAIAAGILKQRTGIDYMSIVQEVIRKNNL